MNGFDIIVVAAVIGAMAGGYRLGFVTRVASWIGLAFGTFLAMRVLPDLLGRLRGGDPTWLLVVTVTVVLIGAMVGQSLGFAVGARIRPLDHHVARADRWAGAGAGVVGVLILVWALLPVFADTPGPVAEQARRSVIAQNLSDHLPDAPDSAQALQTLIGQDNFPRVFDALRPTPDLGPPPAATGLDQATFDRVVASVVKVEGIACSRIQDGTGFVVGPDLVATNAHVVAGERETQVHRDDGSRLDATVVAFDPDRDLAVLRVPSIGRAPLPVGDSSLQATGGVFGHPGGGDLRVAPFAVARRIRAVGRDIYGADITARDVLELRSALRPGDSGSALVDPGGTVVGVAFAIAPDKPDVAYALSTGELRAVLGTDLTREVDTGPCTRG